MIGVVSTLEIHCLAILQARLLRLSGWQGGFFLKAVRVDLFPASPLKFGGFLTIFIAPWHVEAQPQSLPSSLLAVLPLCLSPDLHAM